MYTCQLKQEAGHFQASSAGLIAGEYCKAPIQARAIMLVKYELYSCSCICSQIKPY